MEIQLNGRLISLEIDPFWNLYNPFDTLIAILDLIKTPIILKTGVDYMQMKKILGILLGVCFLMSVTVAAVSAGDVYGKDGRDKFGFDKFGRDKFGFDKHGFDKFGYDRKGFDRDGYNRKGFDKFGHKKGKHTKGHWEFKKTRHNKDNHHKFVWYTNDRVWKWEN